MTVCVSPKRLIIDTDTAGDDVFSLLLGLRRPSRAGLDAITVCNGNVAFEQQVDIALYTVEMSRPRRRDSGYASRLPEPLLAGVDRRRVRARAGRHGATRSFRTAQSAPAEPEHAIDALVRLGSRKPG